ncbi:hypothetical protein E2C01_057290 [Portunus trituberculatus]|uniref:Uncharacterized protein n=1 Tax=Portunus trituberculatus TaxID=210409 RepID=A0A5B7H0M9_PORTR|nr:hypothetical protein [Portunus trituberculatus]
MRTGSRWGEERSPFVNKLAREDEQLGGWVGDWVAWLGGVVSRVLVGMGSRRGDRGMVACTPAQLNPGFLLTILPRGGGVVSGRMRRRGCVRVHVGGSLPYFSDMVSVVWSPYGGTLPLQPGGGMRGWEARTTLRGCLALKGSLTPLKWCQRQAVHL